MVCRGFRFFWRAPCVLHYQSTFKWTMIRRRRRVREIPFSFDSFLDIVANVVGIIIRLILIVWVGARSYTSVQTAVKSPHPTLSPSVGGEGRVSPAIDEPSDPLQAALAQHAHEL